MKIKVTVLTSLMLFLILFSLDTFIYFTLNKHLMDVEENLLSNHAQAVAQYYVNHVSDKETGTNAYTWLHRYVQEGQTILVYDSSGRILAQSGTIVGLDKVLTDFKPTDELQQEIIRTNASMLVATDAPATDSDQHQVLGYIRLISNLNSVREYMHTLLAVLIMGSLGAVTLAAVGSYFVSAAVVRPINQLIGLIERIQANRLNERVQVLKGKDEVSRLAATFNNMLVRIERSFEQQARFVADASHEFRTPLTTIQGYADILRRWGKDDPAVLNKAILVIHTEAERLRNLANDLLTLASLEAASNDLPQRTSALTVIDEALDSLGPLHPEVTLVKSLERSPDVAMAPAHLKQVVTNLIDNAIKHTPAGGRIEVKTLLNRPFLTLQIQDTGQGIPAEDLPYLFERFYRVDKARDRRAGGTGLGLAIVKGLVEMYGGSIRIDSQLGLGTTVVIQLPLAAMA